MTEKLCQIQGDWDSVQVSKGVLSYRGSTVHLFLYNYGIFLGGIYLKNVIMQHWRERDPSDFPCGETPFVISDQDKVTIRDNIVEAVIHAPELIRYSCFSICYILCFLSNCVSVAVVWDIIFLEPLIV